MKVRCPGKWTKTRLLVCDQHRWCPIAKPLTHELKLSNHLPSELYTLLLEDILVLLQKQDERLILKCHSKNLAGTADTKHTFSPIIKLNTVLVRSVATGQLCLSALFLFVHVWLTWSISLSRQTTSPSLSFPCLKTEPRSMSWWRPPSRIRWRKPVTLQNEWRSNSRGCQTSLRNKSSVPTPGGSVSSRREQMPLKSNLIVSSHYLRPSMWL